MAKAVPKETPYLMNLSLTTSTMEIPFSKNGMQKSLLNEMKNNVDSKCIYFFNRSITAMKNPSTA